MLKKLFIPGLRFDWKIVTVTVVSTLLILVDFYHRFTPWKPLDRTILYLLIPLAIIIFVFRENPREYGFQLGDWKAGLVITVGALAIFLPILWLLLRGDRSMQTYYQSLLGPTLPIYTFFELFGWEFLFRGWLTFAYLRKFGPEGLWLQAVPFAIAHVTKPEVETLSTIFGGFAFGWVAWRTKSFLYPFLIHWGIFTFVALVAGGALAEFSVRPALATDQPEIKALIKQVRINPNGIHWQRFVVAVSAEGDFMGCGQVKFHGESLRELASLAVRKRYRNLGVARAIVENLLASHPRPIYLMCRSALGPFYQQFGFRGLVETELPGYFRRVSRLARVLRALHLLQEQLLVMVLAGQEAV